ncbi:MAG: ABC transporter permease [Armatimonadota bacterium]|nr:ABC transporter permease [Armatimonadota bacterium]MDR7450713.1 ABC transporter permease [Armatimonadota bacterium]MDR7466069.1 ABC transporter permease [Armatimonadota bacterium]MDR7493894.1 ABC transporter permease [Armatimonadota bacterium]MDR7503999.1 ABC transporter permease [Armatimonadota bacterium]
MHRYVLRRLTVMVPILLGITVVSYVIMSLTPGDPVQMLISPSMSAEDMAIRRKALGLDQPVHIRYVKWLGELVRGNLGYSFSSGAPVTRRVGERIIPTLKLTGTALLLSYLIGIPVGVVAATRRYSTTDYLVTVITFLGISLPTFFLGLAGIYIFALRLRWLPVGGTMTLGGEGGFLDGLHHLILPAGVLAVAGAGVVARYVRSSLLEVLGQDYVRTARAKGLAEALVLRRHALRNALIPVITLAGLQIPALLAGAVITEQVFEWPGMGRLTIEAINQRDYPVMMAITLITAVLVAAGNLLADIAYAAADPRIHYE